MSKISIVSDILQSRVFAVLFSALIAVTAMVGADSFYQPQNILFQLGEFLYIFSVAFVVSLSVHHTYMDLLVKPFEEDENGEGDGTDYDNMMEVRLGEHLPDKKSEVELNVTNL